MNINYHEIISQILMNYVNIDFNEYQEELVRLLKEVQQSLGFISAEAQEIIATKTNVHKGVISAIIKRYPTLKQENTIHQITICTGERCMRKHSYKLLDQCKKKLQLDKDNISKDRKWKLITQNCLKKCTTSPNILIDGVHYKNVSIEQLNELLDM